MGHAQQAGLPQISLDYPRERSEQNAQPFHPESNQTERNLKIKSDFDYRLRVIIN